MLKYSLILGAFNLLSAQTVSTEAPKKGAKTDEISAYLAASACPDFLTGDFLISNNSQLKQMGFGDMITRRHTERFGEIDLVAAEYPDAGISFGGSVDKICLVTVVGPAAQNSLAGLQRAKDSIGADFQPFPDGTKTIGTISVETFKAQVDDKYSLYAQVSQSVQNNLPVVTYQLFGTVN